MSDSRPWTWQFSLEQASTQKKSSKSRTRPHDPAWDNSDTITSQAYPGEQKVQNLNQEKEPIPTEGFNDDDEKICQWYLSHLPNFKESLDHTSMLLSENFNKVINPSSKVPEDKKTARARIFHLAVRLGETSVLEKRQASGESLTAEQTMKIAKKGSKEAEFETLMNAYHDSSKSPQIPTTREKGKGKDESSLPLETQEYFNQAVDADDPSLNPVQYAPLPGTFQPPRTMLPPGMMRHPGLMPPSGILQHPELSQDLQAHHNSSGNLIARSQFGANLTSVQDHRNPNSEFVAPHASQNSSGELSTRYAPQKTRRRSRKSKTSIISQSATTSKSQESKPLKDSQVKSQDGFTTRNEIQSSLITKDEAVSYPGYSQNSSQSATASLKPKELKKAGAESQDEFPALDRTKRPPFPPIQYDPSSSYARKASQIDITKQDNSKRYLVVSKSSMSTTSKIASIEPKVQHPKASKSRLSELSSHENAGPHAILQRKSSLPISDHESRSSLRPRLRNSGPYNPESYVMPQELNSLGTVDEESQAPDQTVPKTTNPNSKGKGPGYMGAFTYEGPSSGEYFAPQTSGYGLYIPVPNIQPERVRPPPPPSAVVQQNQSRTPLPKWRPLDSTGRCSSLPPDPDLEAADGTHDTQNLTPSGSFSLQQKEPRTMRRPEKQHSLSSSELGGPDHLAGQFSAGKIQPLSPYPSRNQQFSVEGNSGTLSSSSVSKTDDTKEDIQSPTSKRTNLLLPAQSNTASSHSSQLRSPDAFELDYSSDSGDDTLEAEPGGYQAIQSRTSTNNWVEAGLGDDAVTEQHIGEHSFHHEAREGEPINPEESSRAEHQTHYGSESFPNQGTGGGITGAISGNDANSQTHESSYTVGTGTRQSFSFEEGVRSMLLGSRRSSTLASTPPARNDRDVDPLDSPIFFRTGSWKCPSSACGRYNLALHITCVHCQTDYSGATIVVVLVGDWLCRHAGCSYHNFGKDLRCARCRSPRAWAAATAALAQSWSCGSCRRYNNARVTNCVGCGTSCISAVATCGSVGDWKCTSIGCSSYNFVQNKRCLACGAYRVIGGVIENTGNTSLYPNATIQTTVSQYQLVQHMSPVQYQTFAWFNPNQQ